MSTVGAATVRVTTDIAGWADYAIKSMQDAATKATIAALEPVAATAEAEWYGANGVQKVTGLSGQFAVVVAENAGKHGTLISVGSTDGRIAGKKNIPVPKFVHRPGKLATDLKVVTREEFFKAPKMTRLGRAKFARPGVAVGDYLILIHSDRARDGKTLLPIFVNGPGKLAIKAAVPGIGRAMRTAAESTHAR